MGLFRRPSSPTHFVRTPWRRLRLSRTVGAAYGVRGPSEALIGWPFKPPRAPRTACAIRTQSAESAESAPHYETTLIATRNSRRRDPHLVDPSWPAKFAGSEAAHGLSLVTKSH